MSGAPLWTAAEAASATDGSAAGAWTATGVSIDSRTVARGDLFIALEGPSFDGHDFVAEALAKGAAAAVVAREPEPGIDPARLLRVGETMAGLEALGRAARARVRATVIAVTGSVGKTGTKEALRLALDAQGRTHASSGNLNNHWGAPLSLARMPPDSAFAVFELGMNRPGELGPLARQVGPHVAVITTVEAVHLEFFSSVEAIADAKAEIFEGLEPKGVAVLNRDNAHFARLALRANARGARVISFGAAAEADARLIKAAYHPTCCCLSAEIGGEPVTYKVGVPGRHWASNSLAVLAAVSAAGADIGRAALALAQLTPLQGRGARHTVRLRDGAFELIDDSYNASPASMRAAFAILADTPVAKGRHRVAVLGDMLELGAGAAALHAELAQDLLAAGVDRVFTAGANMAALHRALPGDMRAGHADNSDGLIPALRRAVGPGDAVLVKGSLGSRMAVVVEALLALGLAAPRAANG